MNITKAFKKRKALITFITAGDPNLKTTEKLIKDLERSGADIIELGIPFSDPLADGPIIQASHQRALKNNVSLADVFKLVKRAKATVPIVFMLSANLVEKYGWDKFYADCEASGVSGAIIPDLPPEETSNINGNVESIFLIAPTTSEERIKKITSACAGFVYLVSTTGITGKRTKLAEGLAGTIATIRKYTSLPIAIGFGISNPAQAKEAVKNADGVIVGSAIVELIAKKQFNKLNKLVASFRKALDA
jgi:tryptophan synthase alpha chain